MEVFLSGVRPLILSDKVDAFLCARPVSRIDPLPLFYFCRF